jgi:hypothetical protein
MWPCDGVYVMGGNAVMYPHAACAASMISKQWVVYLTVFLMRLSVRDANSNPLIP